eukprot:jgi/Psemu1/58784/gm1.58784_g
MLYLATFILILPIDLYYQSSDVIRASSISIISSDLYYQSSDLNGASSNLNEK